LTDGVAGTAVSSAGDISVLAELAVAGDPASGSVVSHAPTSSADPPRKIAFRCAFMTDAP